MKIAVQDIKEVPQTASYGEPVEHLNTLLQHGAADYHAIGPVNVTVSYYRAGMDVFLDGDLRVDLRGSCSRCLTDYPLSLAREFSLVLAPESELGPGDDDGELADDDLALSYYAGEEIDLAPLVEEQVILGLPTRPLCRTECRGLCPHCGAPLNDGDCGCTVVTHDPRLAILRNLKVSDLK